MTISEFQRLLEIWGGSPQRWPPEDREQAMALLGESAQARQLQEEARKLDRALDALPPAIDLDESARRLKGAILSRAARLPEKLGLGDWLRLHWARAGAFVAVAAAGAPLGWGVFAPGDSQTRPGDGR